MRKSTVSQSWRALTAYRMKWNGSTNKRIAQFLGVDKRRVRTLIELGERLDSLDKPPQG